MKTILDSLPGAALVAAMVVGSLSAVAVADTGYEVAASSTYSGGLKLQAPIDVNMEVNGVKLNSVYFDGDKVQAFVILQNRTPSAVNPKVGISLFDARGKLLATGIDVSGFSFTGDKIGAGGQKNIELSFAKFINDFKKASSFQIVFAIGKTKEPPASSTKSEPFSTTNY